MHTKRLKLTNMSQALLLVLVEHTFSYVKMVGEMPWLELLVCITRKARACIVFILATALARKNLNKEMSARCSELKHNHGTVESLIIEMEKLARKTSLSATVKDDLLKALTYFKNHRNMMNCPMYLEQNSPIGSGVTETACKTLVKQRLCCSGMRWKKHGAHIVLTLRALVQSGNRWEQFWSKIK